jgi:hypothetical protein
MYLGFIKDKHLKTIMKKHQIRIAISRLVFYIFWVTATLNTVETRAAIFSDSIPTGWRGSINNLPEVIMGIDTTVKHSGKASGFVQCRPLIKSGFGSLMQSVAADEYRNKRVRLTVYVKTKDAELVQIFMSVHSSDSAIAYGNSLNESLHENSDWTLCHVTLDIPENSRNIDFGVVLTGQGTVWVDDYKLEIVDDSVPSDDRMIKGLTAKRKLPKPNMTVQLNPKPMNLGFEDH